MPSSEDDVTKLEEPTEGRPEVPIEERLDDDA
jgi:hypothetical protein